MLSSSNEFTKLKKGDYFKSLYGNIGEQIRGNFIPLKCSMILVKLVPILQT